MAVQYGSASTYQVQMKGPYGSVSIRVVELTLDPEAWKGAVSPYAQEVMPEGITASCKVDLQPSPEQLEALRVQGIALAAVNEGGRLSVYAFGDKPREEMTFQATVTEVQR